MRGGMRVYRVFLLVACPDGYTGPSVSEWDSDAIDIKQALLRERDSDDIT
jgi:hypothetical protein